MSSAEFLHPTSTPGWLLRGKSKGQNTRINPFEPINRNSPCGATVPSPKSNSRFVFARGMQQRSVSTFPNVAGFSFTEDERQQLTKLVSREAILSMGRKKKKKNNDKIRNPLVARPYTRNMVSSLSHQTGQG
jgi:hypothetical protein